MFDECTPLRLIEALRPDVLVKGGNLLDLGVASTLTNHISRDYAVGDRQCAACYTANALGLTSSLANVAGFALAALWPLIDWVALFNVAASVPSDEVSRTVAIAAALVLLGLPASLASRILAGYQEVHISNLVVAVGGSERGEAVIGDRSPSLHAGLAGDVSRRHHGLQFRGPGRYSVSAQTMAAAAAGFAELDDSA